MMFVLMFVLYETVIYLLVKMFLPVFKPVLSLLVGPGLVVIHSIVLTDSVGVTVVLVSLLMVVTSLIVLVVSLEGVHVDKHVGVKTGVVLWVVHGIESDSARVSEQGHHGQG